MSNLELRDRDALEQQVRTIIAEQLQVELERVTPEKSIVGDLWADSMAVLELTGALEEAFQIEVAEDEASSLRTVGDVLHFVCARVAHLPAPGSS